MLSFKCASGNTVSVPPSTVAAVVIAVQATEGVESEVRHFFDFLILTQDAREQFRGNAKTKTQAGLYDAHVYPPHHAAFDIMTWCFPMLEHHREFCHRVGERTFIYVDPDLVHLVSNSNSMEIVFPANDQGRRWEVVLEGTHVCCRRLIGDDRAYEDEVVEWAV